MIDSLLPFTSDAEGAEPVEGTRRRRTVLAVGALATVALATGAVLLLGGSEEDDLALGVAAAAADVAQPSSSPSAVPAVPAEAPVAVRGRGRNPFEVQLSAPVPGALPAAPVGGGDPGQVAVPPASSTLPLSGGTTPNGPAAGPAVQDAPPTGTGTTATPRLLALVRVDGTGDDRRAVLLLDGTEHVAGVGDSIGPEAELLLLSLQEGPDAGQWTAVVQRGRGEPFDVVSGTPVPLSQP